RPGGQPIWGRDRAPRRACEAALRRGVTRHMKDAPLPRWAAYAIYFVLLLWAGLEILRSMGRLDGVVFLGYVQTGEAVLQHKDPYGYGLTLINTWPRSEEHTSELQSRVD